MIERDVAGAAARRFDLVVAGGGVLGAMTALLGAARGLDTLLIERDDFGGGATWNGLRILHGGFRSLQRLALAERHAAAAESAWLHEAFPELVEPLACVLPLDGHGAWRPAAAAAALAAQRALGGWRETPDGRLLDALELRALHPGAGRAAAGVLWRDALLPRPGRLVIEVLRWAVAAGATVLSRVEAVRLLVERGRVRGLAARDRVAGEPLELQASAVAWCTGSHCPASDAGARLPSPPSVLAFNVLLARELPAGRALAVRSPQGAALFLVPLEGNTLAGTGYAAAADAPSPADVDRFLGDLAAAAPFLAPRGHDVLRILAGPQPAAGGSVRPAARAVHHDHGATGGPLGLACAWPVKLTTARREAERLLRALVPGTASHPPPRPATCAVPGAGAAARLAAEDPTAFARLAAAIASRECVLEPDDLLLRRTDWALDPRRRPALAAALPSGQPVGGG